MLIEILFIFLFIVLNGFFSGSEVAVIATRKTRVTELEKLGKKNAQTLHKLKSNPDRFLATVQVGITVVGAMASGIGGASAIRALDPYVKSIPVTLISSYSEAISVAAVVLVISYFTLVLGELLPKSIALKSPEKIALIVARPILMFSKITSLIVSFLTLSTNTFLKIFGLQLYSQKSFVTEEEIKMFIREGKDIGFFEPEEEKLIHSVFEFTDLSVKEIMVPIAKVSSFSIDTPVENILSIIMDEQYSRYPVYSKEKTDIRGILYAKDLFKKITRDKVVDLRKILRVPYFVPESMKISALLREMQRKGVHISLVVDEYGSINGIATIEDILEEIVGEIRDEYDVELPVIKLRDNSFLVDASISIRDLRDDHGIMLPESPDYDTVGGYIITHLQRIPSEGEKAIIGQWEFNITQLVGKRIARTIMRETNEPTDVPTNAQLPDSYSS